MSKVVSVTTATKSIIGIVEGFIREHVDNSAGMADTLVEDFEKGFAPLVEAEVRLLINATAVAAAADGIAGSDAGTKMTRKTGYNMFISETVARLPKERKDRREEAINCWKELTKEEKEEWNTKADDFNRTHGISRKNKTREGPHRKKWNGYTMYMNYLKTSKCVPLGKTLISYAGETWNSFDNDTKASWKSKAEEMNEASIRQ
ncbi:MAG: hypothetical protein ACYCOU_01920 [Sulfobacillus sp.]